MTKDNIDLSEKDIEDLLKRVGPLQEPPEAMRARVHSAVKDAWAEEVTAGRQNRRSWFAIAASVTVAAGALYLYQLSPGTSAPDIVARVDGSLSSLEIRHEDNRWQRIDTPQLAMGAMIRATEPASISFTHGMNVRLNSGTELKLASADEVSLAAGALYLDSYDKPEEVLFNVVTPHGTAADIGTQFMVTSNPSGWSVQVREGRVEMADGPSLLQLAEGQKAHIDTNDLVTEEPVSSTDPSWAWTEKSRPPYSLEGKVIDDYLNWVARETGKKVEYRSSEAANLARTTTMHGSIDRYAASESLDVIMPGTAMKVIENREKVILVDLVR